MAPAQQTSCRGHCSQEPRADARYRGGRSAVCSTLPTQLRTQLLTAARGGGVAGIFGCGSTRGARVVGPKPDARAVVSGVSLAKVRQWTIESSLNASSPREQARLGGKE